MSAGCAFEFKSTLKADDVQSKLSKIWLRHNARGVYVRGLKEENSYMCHLDWFFFCPEEEKKPVKVTHV